LAWWQARVFYWRYRSENHSNINWAWDDFYETLHKIENW
jgi:hypothetical protein